MVRMSVSKKIRAPLDLVWDTLADLESWPSLAAQNAKNRVISHRILSREGNVIVCDEYEQAGWLKARHRDKYILYPNERLEEEIITGDFAGGIAIQLKAIPEGTLVEVDANISPKRLWLRILGIFLDGETMLSQFWHDLLSQLASVTEKRDASHTLP